MSRLWLLMLLAACGGQDEGTQDTAHPGEPTVRSRRATSDSTAPELEGFRGAKYEGALLDRLVGHYREEVAAIDTALPRLRAEHVRSLAERMRDQRLEDIRELTQQASE